jgi:hypothetical protein
MDNRQMIYFLVKGMDGSGCGQINTLSWNVTGRTDENYEKPLMG